MHSACVRCKLRMVFCSSGTKVVRYLYLFVVSCVIHSHSLPCSLVHSLLLHQIQSDYYWWEIMAFLRKLAIRGRKRSHGNGFDLELKLAVKAGASCVYERSKIRACACVCVCVCVMTSEYMFLNPSFRSRVSRVLVLMSTYTHTAALALRR